MTIRPTEESWKLLDEIFNEKKIFTGKIELFLILVLFILAMTLFFLLNIQFFLFNN